MEMTITEFCDQHRACYGGREWAMSTGCATMAELWQRGDMRADWRVWIATRRGVIDDKTLRLFACWSVRQVWNLLTDERSRNAIEVAERYAEGKATDEELATAQAAARAAAEAAAGAARGAAAAAWDAAGAALDAAAAARGAAAAAWDAAGAALDAAGAARDAAGANQGAWLLANAKPNFEVTQ
jgi:hypothetical protein